MKKIKHETTSASMETLGQPENGELAWQGAYDSKSTANNSILINKINN